MMQELLWASITPELVVEVHIDYRVLILAKMYMALVTFFAITPQGLVYSDFT